MAYDKNPRDGYWIQSENGTAVHVGHVGEKPYILVGGAEVPFTISNALLIARQLAQHAIIAKFRKS